jgi:hypothetical protein
MVLDLIARVRSFSGDPSPQECKHDHKLMGTGAVFYQSVGLLQCAHCRGWALIRKPCK